MTLYAGHYPRSAFSSLLAFQAFCWHGSSAQQVLFTQGPCEAVLEWFVPESDLPPSLAGHVGQVAQGHAAVRDVLKRINVGPTLGWLHEERFEEAVVDGDDPEVSVVARTASGWVAFFTLDSDL